AGRRAWCFLQLGWQHERGAGTERFIAGIKAAAVAMPNLRIVVLANCPDEADHLCRNGIRAEFCHQNAFLDPSRYRIAGGHKEYDAIYIARITPFKRHALAAKIPKLLLVGDYSERESEYAKNTLHQMSGAEYRRKVRSFRIPKAIGKAACGLCLSAEEGAMFVSAEYVLCGAPVVNTSNIGGRDFMMPKFAVKHAEDSPQSVAAAVESWKAAPPDPAAIRRAAIEMMAPHRRKLRELIDEAFAEARLNDPKLPEKFTGNFPHKLGLRCRRTPLSDLLHGLTY
ncbi:MAG: hypothetical protein AB7F40_11770, partial [Victivallaceae bacterium]